MRGGRLRPSDPCPSKQLDCVGVIVYLTRSEWVNPGTVERAGERNGLYMQLRVT